MIFKAWTVSNGTGRTGLKVEEAVKIRSLVGKTEVVTTFERLSLHRDKPLDE